MDQQKPRDNSMYYLSEKNNLKQNDKALERRGDKAGIFGHRVLTMKEVHTSNKAA